MPAITGPVQIFNIGGGVVHFGDSAVISPKSTSKTYAGAGSDNTGGFVVTGSGFSASNTLDSNLVDQPQVGNN